VSSNQSTIWTALRALGVTRPITGFGRLLESLAPPRPRSAAG
jgi:maleate cis-trans isomerase